MNTNMTLNSLIAAAALSALSSALVAEETYWVALSSDVTMNRASIANAGHGDKSVWIQRSYDQQISLGEDTQSGEEIYPHQSVQIRYVVDCAQNKLNMVAWKMFSGANSQGNLVWESGVQGDDAAYRYSPGTEEERSVAFEICGSSVASR